MGRKSRAEKLALIALGQNGINSVKTKNFKAAAASINPASSTFYQATEPTDAEAASGTLQVGDIWMNPSAGYRISIYTDTGWAIKPLGNTLNSNLITGTLVADTVVSSYVYTGAITANQITAGQISADRLNFDITGGNTSNSSAINIQVPSLTVGITSVASFWGMWSQGGNTGLVAVGGGTGLEARGSFKAIVSRTTGGGGEWALHTNNKVHAGAGYSPFTGSHISFSKDTPEIGDIVSTINSLGVGINQSYVEVSTAISLLDKAVFGVVSHTSKDSYKFITTSEDFCDRFEIDKEETTYTIKPEYVGFLAEFGDKSITRVAVNSLGEGMMNVCESNGNIDNGDYICSSTVRGKGQKQDSDILHNYTVAKSLTNVDWSTEVVGENGCFEFEGVKCKLISCTYHCG